MLFLPQHRLINVAAFGGGGGGGGDPHFANVVLLSAFDGADGATSATDDSNTGRTLTFAGNAQIDTAQSKFGGASLLLDGTGDWVTAADSADWQFDGEFTIEAWVRWNALPVTASLLSHGASAISYGWWLTSSNTGQISFRFDDGGDGTPLHSFSSGATLVTTGTWYHIAVDRDSSDKMRLYINGVMRGSKTSASGTSFNSTAALNIGAIGSVQSPFNGWFDEVRITKGTGRYASDSGFDVPADAFPRS